MRLSVFLIASVGYATASPLSQKMVDPGTSCPATVDPSDVAPYSIVPVSSRDPLKSFGSSTTAVVSPGDMCSWFAFKVPMNPSSSFCVLSFIFPQDGQSSSRYNISGASSFELTAMYSSTGDYDVTPRMTWNSQPHGGRISGAVQKYQNTFKPNEVVAISTGQCTTSIADLRLYVRICSWDSSFTFSQSTNTCPIGLYLLVFPKRSNGSSSGSSQAPTHTNPPTAPRPTQYSGGVGRRDLEENSGVLSSMGVSL